MALLSNINDKFAVDSTGAIQFNGQVGTSGYVLKSNANAAPTWVDPSTVIGGPYLPLTGGTLTGATATASGISFTVGGALTGTSATFAGNVTSTEVKVVNSSATSILYAESDTLALVQLKDDGLNKTYNIEIGRSSTAGDLTFWSSDGEKVRFTEAGNVGIGTDSPQHKLVAIGTIGFGLNYNGGVYANSSVTNVDENWGLEVQRTANVDDYNTRLKYYPVSGGSRKAGIYDSRNARFSLYSDTNNNPDIIIPHGNVGIGTISPGSKLVVASGTDTAYNDGALKVVGSIALNSANNLNPSLNRWVLRPRAEGVEGSFDIYDARHSSSRLTIDTSGNVGIGVAQPLSPLTVKANVGGSALRFVGRSSDSISGIDFFNSTQTVGNYFQSNGSWMRARADGGFHFSKGSTPITTDVDGFTIEGMNVGIGTDSPGAKLTVKGATQFGGNSTSVAQATTEYSAYGTTQNLYTITLNESSVWSPGIAVINFAASRSGLQKHYGGQIIVRLTYYNGSGVSGQGGWGAPSSVAAVVAYSGQAEGNIRVYVNGTNTGNPMTIQIGVRDIDDTTNYFVSDIRVTLRSGVSSITT